MAVRQTWWIFTPPPRFNKIIEPFAGSARYSLKYWERDVLLVDKYDVIVRIWKWLQQCSEGDILKLPRLKYEQKLTDFTFDCEEARLFMGFVVQFGMASPGNKISRFRSQGRPNSITYTLQRIAKDLHKIRHWEVRKGDYQDIPNEPATWFIDPPYQFGGHSYVHGNKKLDFKALAAWCLERMGQYIVCENNKATWLPFYPLKAQRVKTGMHQEVLFTNLETSYNVQQLTLQL